MPRWVTVEITADIIARARQADCYDCAVAIALKEATGFVWHVFNENARIETLCSPLGKLRPTWKLPQQLQALIRQFDRGEHVAPCSFRLPARFADKQWLDYG